MKQKYLFWVLAVILLVQGAGFYLAHSQLVAGMYPSLDAVGAKAVGDYVRLSGMVTFVLGLVTIAVRESRDVLWAYAVGLVLVGANGFRDIFVQDVQVPLAAPIIQLALGLACGYLWLGQRKVRTA